MVVNDFNIVCVAAFKPKANPPLFVDADAPLPLTVALEGFETVSGRCAQKLDAGSGMEPSEFFPRNPHPLPIKLADIQPSEEGGCLLGPVTT
jgi:hypothetical protein